MPTYEQRRALVKRRLRMAVYGTATMATKALGGQYSYNQILHVVAGRTRDETCLTALEAYLDERRAAKAKSDSR